ncbi:MAG: sulfur transferase domain-containing protein, partial [Paracoccaceae bacterium]|nr:sulfur transferase domain-containing protein [Paracoccaceae bacterium]
MDLRPLTPTYAVAPQIAPEDLPAIKAAGYSTVIDNRPDAEIPADLHGAAMQARARALGLDFVI